MRFMMTGTEMKRYEVYYADQAFSFSIFKHAQDDYILLCLVPSVFAHTLAVKLTDSEIKTLEQTPQSFKPVVDAILSNCENPTVKKRRLDGRYRAVSEDLLLVFDPIEDAYDRWADTYDTMPNLTRDLDAKYFTAWVDERAPADVLELGCGTGKNTQVLIDGRRVIGLDFSAQMLSRCKQVAPTAELHQADINRSWPVKDQSVDAVVCNLVLEHIENLEHIGREAARVLRPGGCLRLSELHPDRQKQGKKARFKDGDQMIEVAAFEHSETEFNEAFTKSKFKLVNKHEPRARTDAPTRPPRLLILEYRYVPMEG